MCLLLPISQQISSNKTGIYDRYYWKTPKRWFIWFIWCKHSQRKMYASMNFSLFEKPINIKTHIFIQTIHVKKPHFYTNHPYPILQNNPHIIHRYKFLRIQKKRTIGQFTCEKSTVPCPHQACRYTTPLDQGKAAGRRNRAGVYRNRNASRRWTNKSAIKRYVQSIQGYIGIGMKGYIYGV